MIPRSDAADARAELEAALAAHFDADHLEVYADFLQSLGDPRGELIALDLQGETSGREEAVVAWLGTELAGLLATSVLEVGFVMDLDLRAQTPSAERLLAALSASPAAGCVRGATIGGDPVWIASALDQLTRRPLPWLERLSVKATRDFHDEPIVSAELALQLAIATPALVQLEVWGRRVFGALAHVAVRSLRITGYDAVGSILGDGYPLLPAVATLDLAMDPGRASDPRAVAELMYRERLPALRALDLSRNEPGRTPPHNLGGDIDTLAFLARFPARGQLSRLRLPSVRTQANADALAVILADMPALRQVTVARAYHAHYVALPALVEGAEARPWLPIDEVEGRLFELRVDNANYRFPLEAIISWLDESFDALPAETRAAWGQIFELADTMASQYSIELIETALAPIDVRYPGLAAMDAVRAAIAALPTGRLYVSLHIP